MSKTVRLIAIGVACLASVLIYFALQSSSSNGTSESAGASGGGARGAASGGRPSGGGRQGRSRPPALVVTAPVREASINDRLRAIGSSEARASVGVVPLSAGTLTSVSASAGMRVERGDVLATLDDTAEAIARDRAARATNDARRRLERLETLFASRTSTQVDVDDARATFEDAELAQRDAELQLSRRTLVAPISGIVGIFAVEAGQYVTTQTDIVTIDDRSTLDVEFRVPERFAASLANGQSVEATAYADPGRALSGEISVIGGRVDPVSRTLPVKARFDNSDDRLRPGMSFQLSLSFPGERFAAIDPLAVQWDSSGSFAWQVVDDKSNRVPVRIVQRNADSVLVDGALSPGDVVVTEGVLSLRDGGPIRVAGGGSSERSGERSEGQGQRAKPAADKAADRSERRE